MEACAKPGSIFDDVEVRQNCPNQTAYIIIIHSQASDRTLEPPNCLRLERRALR